MPCQPIDDSNITLPSVPDGFNGLAVPQLPPFDVPFSPLPLEDLLELFNSLSMVLPPGILKPHLSAQFSKNVIDAILSMLQAFMPFLMLYTFFMPLLNMILCVIEVLCAISNPFKLVKAIKRLFRVCIPEFIALFPFAALILMILALLLLILALILYLIQRIAQLIKQIIENIKLLAKAVSSVDNDSVIAITIKLGDLLCILQNLFALFGVIAIIIEIIQRLLNLSFKLPPCDDSDNSGDGCCTTDVCPAFIKNNRQIISTSGTLQYFNNTIKTHTSFGSTVLRAASFQLYDVLATPELAFSNINQAIDLPDGVSKVFFPEGETYSITTNPSSVPYTVDLRIFYNPDPYGRSDSNGARYIRIKNCIVLKKPADGTLDFQNNIGTPFNGTLFLGGGVTYEDDGVTRMVGPGAGSLDSLVHFDDIIGDDVSLSQTGSITYNGVEFSFNINHDMLVAKSLITVGCHPDVAFDKNFINNTIGARINANSAALANIKLPDIQAIQDNIISAVNHFRQNVSVDTAQDLQNTITSQLNGLQSQVNQTVENVVNIGFDPFKSDFVLDPSIQFTTKSINIVVTLNEAGGNNIANNLPAEVGANLAKNLSAIVNFGVINDFKYDGSSKFIAQITSKDAGNGSVSVSYNNQFISILNNPTNTTIVPSVSIKSLIYTFVQSSVMIGSGSTAGELGDVLANNNIGGDAGAVRRDETDVGSDGGNE